MPPFEGPCLCGDPKCWKCGPYCGGDEDEDDALETTLGDVANALGVPLGDRPEGIAGIAKAWRERAEAAEARVAEMEAALRWRSVGEDLPAAGQCVMVSNPMAGLNPRKEAPRYVERYYNHPHRIWLDLDGRTVPPPTHWRPLPQGPEVKS